MTELAIVRTTHGPTADRVPAVGLSNVDGWTNVLTGLGVANRDKRKSAAFTRGVALQREELESLFHDDDMICRICELPAREMTRAWIEIAGDAEKVENKIAELNVRRKMFEALTWARLYGASVIVMIVNDGRAMDQPLNLDGVTAIDDLLVLDRHDISIARKYADARKPKFGQPELFEIRTTAIDLPGQTNPAESFGARIHESRCLLFEGTLTGRRRKIDNEGWAQTIIDRLYEPVRDFTASYGGAAVLLQDYSQAVFKIKDLAKMLAAGQDGLVLRRLQLLDLARSICRAIPLDAEGEDFKREATPTAGLPDLLDRMASRLSAATGIPITLLMGESPGGLNASGEGEQRNWYNAINNDQETILRGPLALLLKVIAKAVKYKPKDTEDDQIPFTFCPLWQPTQKETAETRLTVMQTDIGYHAIGALDSAEISVSRWGGDQYSMETTIDQDVAPKNSNKNPDDTEDDTGEADTESDPADDDAKEALRGSGVPSDKTVQDTAMNGAQMKEIAATLALVRAEEMDKPTAIAFITLACPALDPAKVATMINGITIVIPPPPVIAVPGQGFGNGPPKPGEPAPAKVPPAGAPVVAKPKPTEEVKP